MPTQAKNEYIQEMSEKFGRAKAAVLADYKGITAQEMTRLRVLLRQHSVEFMVVKNTLARIAAKNTPYEAMGPDLKGPLSLVVSYEDAIAPAKALAEFSKTQPVKEPAVVCGVVEGKRITADELKELSNLPPKEVMIARLLSTMQAPTSNFVGVFNGLLRKMVGTLEAVKEKKSNG